MRTTSSAPARRLCSYAAAAILDAQFVEIPGVSHLGVFTHGDAVVAALLEFFGAAPTIT
ncbi:MAG TPA: hypothetical protein VHP57_10395 [Acidimicrobiia bacterium]|nr:hypothetical protein [Acidimicrobiia bacterium]